MIARFKKTTRKSGAGAMLFLAVLACIVLTNAYIAKADFEFGEPVNLESVIPALDAAHDGINSFTDDMLEMYIESDRKGGQGEWDLWILMRASKEDGWGPPENLGPAVNSPNVDSLPCVSGNGLTLYFNSDRPGGYGGNDIWMTRRASRSDPWQTPLNLGPSVNGSAHESDPWISADGLELYFQSWRLGGCGDADIYVARR